MKQPKTMFPQRICMTNVLRRHRPDGVAEISLNGVLEMPADWFAKHGRAAGLIVTVTAVEVAPRHVGATLAGEESRNA